MKSTSGCHSHLNKHNLFRIVPKLNGFLYTRLHWNGSIVSDWENDIKQQSAWKQQQQYLQITAEFIVIDFVGNLNKTLMGLDEQLVRLATKMNFHSPLNYNATCTLMLPKSKLVFFTENRTSRVEKNTTKIRMKMDCRNWLFKSWIVLSTGKITIHGIAQLVSLILIRRIVIYLMDTAIHVLNNRACSLNLILWKLRF